MTIRKGLCPRGVAYARCLAVSLHGGSDCVDAVAEVQVGVAQVVGVVLVGLVADGSHDPVGVSQNGVVVGRIGLFHLADDAAQLRSTELNRNAGGGFLDALEGAGEFGELFLMSNTRHIHRHNKYPFLKVRAIWNREQ